uniref:Uncharacterized protein n=1 Tax=Arundo donax TaxID=35708 RepID=A0A0A9HPD9_ARUDO
MILLPFSNSEMRKTQKHFIYLLSRNIRD